MKTFREFVLESDYYYHGTTPDNAESILKHGFDPNKSKYGKKIYLTKNHGEASKYGKITNNGKLGTVIKIHKDALKNDHKISDHSGVVEYGDKIHQKHISKV